MDVNGRKEETKLVDWVSNLCFFFIRGIKYRGKKYKQKQVVIFAYCNRSET